MHSVTEIVEGLGGPAKLAEILKRPTTTVASWTRRKSIPAAYWPNLIAIADARGVRGITYESLAGLAAQRPRMGRAVP